MDGFGIIVAVITTSMESEQMKWCITIIGGTDAGSEELVRHGEPA